MSTRAERLSRLATKNGFGYEEREGGASLLNDEGEVISRLSVKFVEAVADVCDDDAESILLQLHVMHLQSSDSAFRRGHRSGRAGVIEVVHELLGIDRISAALEEAATRSRQEK